MKGCLSLIIKTIIAVLVFFGLLHLGVIDFLKDKIREYNGGQTQEEMIEKAKDIIDLSEIDDEYTIDKNLKIFQNRMIVADHDASGQKMVLIEPKFINILTKEDIKSENIEQKIKDNIAKYKYQPIKFEKIEVVQRGEMSGVGQQIPYVKVRAKVSNLPVKDMEGILGVAELKDGKNLIVVSVNEKGKYSQIVADAFYKQVR